MKHFNRTRNTLLILLCVVLVIGYVSLSFFVKRKIENKLAHIHGKASSIRVNLLTRSLYIQNLQLTPPENEPYQATLKYLNFRHVSVLRLLFNKQIVVGEIQADSGTLQYNRSISPQWTDSKQAGMEIKVNKISFTNFHVSVKKDTIVQLTALLKFQLKEASITYDSTRKAKYTLGGIDFTASNINISRSSGMYGVSVSRFHFNSDDERIIIDSGLLIPNHSKFEFAHIRGEETARIDIAVQRLTLEGIKLQEIMHDTTFTATKMEIDSFDLYSFKDKRVPFLRTHNIPLPMESFRKLPYLVRVDSLILKNSRITIEEFPAGGIESGTVVFNEVNAAASRFGNRNDSSVVQSTLKATGLLMGVGKIDATYTLPLDGSPTYTVTGTIGGMPLEKMNPVLENLVRVKIKSGQLNALVFNFQYTDLRSTGTLEINYEDLRLEGLNRKNESTHELKTLLINTLIRKDKDQSISRLERTGKIDIERERRRHIFNVWWKSILDGLKSTVLGEKPKKQR